jgi:hypothetical protein
MNLLTRNLSNKAAGTPDPGAGRYRDRAPGPEPDQDRAAPPQTITGRLARSAYRKGIVTQEQQKRHSLSIKKREIRP